MKSISRRKFLNLSAVAASSLMILPRHVLGGKQYVAPSDKLNIAGIGVGGQGGGDISQMLSENIVALCDVDWTRAARTFEKFPDTPRYRDFRIMLEKQKDIDAVVVGTPDHVHAVAAMAAIHLGKHVFCEKPLTHTIFEARTLTEAARKAGVATQMGNQGHAMESIRILCEWIWDGANGLRIWPEQRMREYRPPKTLPRSVGHYEEWILSCKGGEPAVSNFDYAGPLTETVLLGNVAMRTGVKLHWDSENMRFPNFPEADQFLHRQYREGWSL